MRPWWPAALALVTSVVACSRPSGDAPRDRADALPTPAAGPPARGIRVTGAAAMERFQCARCHLEAPPGVRDDSSCFQCHRAIDAGQVQAPDEATTVKWRARVAPMLYAPTLVAIGSRLRRAWVSSYLQAPFDLRPHLAANMPRLAISPEEADAIAAYLVPEGEPSGPDPRGDPARGAALYDAKGCAVCHAFSGVRPAIPSTHPRPEREPAWALAPDLRFTRDRSRPEAVAAWLRSPLAVKPDARMPELGLTAREADDLTAFVLRTPLPPLRRAPLAPRRPVLARRVTFEEVSERVFRRTCWHCHADPDFARGEGGPGNTGGFGFAGRRLILADYEGVSSGALDAHGERRSLFAKGDSGVPWLLASLLARREEENDPEARPAVRGMPLGLPALPLEDIQLVETWIAQGRPR